VDKALKPYLTLPCVSQDALDYVHKLREVLWPGLCKDATPPLHPIIHAWCSGDGGRGRRPLSTKHGMHCLRPAQMEGVGMSERPEQGSAEEVVLPRELGTEEDWEAVGACLGRTVRQLLVALLRQDGPVV